MRTWIAAERVAVAVGAIVVLGAFVLYLATAARDIVPGDTPELTAVALTLGVAHPPGYPLFTMIGWLFGQLPVGPLPFRIALLSVVAHAATVGVVYATTYRFTLRTSAAAVAAVALATEPLFWSWSLVAEVFPLNDLLAATMLLLVALWHEHPERKRLLIAGGLVGGLGMAHHQTIALVSPAVFYVLWRRQRELIREPGVLGATAVAFVAGLLPYVELLVAAARHPVWSWGDLRTPSDLLAHVLRQSYGTGSLIVGAQFTGGPVLDRVILIFTALDPLQWLLLAAGAVAAWRVRRWYATYLLIAFIVAGPAFTAYSNVKVAEDTARAILERFFLMPHTVVAPLAGFAVLAAEEAAGRVGLRPALAGRVAAAAAAALALLIVPLDYRRIDQSDQHQLRTFGGDILATLKPNSIFMAGGDPVVYSVLYLQSIEGQRRDVALMILPLVSTEWYVREFKRQYPDVAVPDARYAPGAGQIRSFIDANYRKRPIAALGDLPDESTKGIYWYYSRGILYEVRAMDDIVTLDDMTAENEAILGGYHIPRADELKGPNRAWERLNLVDYSQAYYRVGKEYEIAANNLKSGDPRRAAGLFDAAKDWYRRALGVDPTLVEAKTALERLAR